jgi:hypothetical protein
MKKGFVLVLAAVAILPGCGAKKAERPATIAAAPAQQPEVAKAVGALEKGDWKKARKTLTKLLKEQPGNAAAGQLLRQIDIDPKKLLGTNSFAYQTRPGDSYRSLAQRYLGDSMMFYALARYNGVAVPAALVAGSTLQIPGSVQVAEPKAPLAKPAKPAKSAAKPSAPAAKPGKASAAKPQSSAALASALRRQGLSALSKGRPGVAVSYLERAASADPANKLVAADLARARRVRDAVRQ